LIDAKRTTKRGNSKKRKDGKKRKESERIHEIRKYTTVLNGNYDE